uniref:BH3-interacting domain death agonist n=1 Tax=Bos taurus TaxID=9913 RepID=Q05KI5_BOVIN|nr:BH3 interacting domain death agonist transcript variant 2 [Bos taurus]
MDLKVSNGPGPGDERTTSLLLLGFLQSCPHSCFQRELEALGHELPGHLFHDDELQTDGNRCSHFPLAAEAETDRRQCLAAALEQLMQTCPPDVDHEKTQLLLTMLLAKKIADHSPALLRDVFHTTVTFINQNLLAYVRNLVRNMD